MFSEETKRKAILYVCQNNPAARAQKNPWKWVSDMLEELIKDAEKADSYTTAISTGGMMVLINHYETGIRHELVLLACIGE